MTPVLHPHDLAENLTSGEDIKIFLTDALESGDAGFIAHAMGIAARAQGMSDIARETGLAREALYRSLTAEGNPTLKSVLAVLTALGLKLSAVPVDATPARKRAPAQK